MWTLWLIIYQNKLNYSWISYTGWKVELSYEIMQCLCQLANFHKAHLKHKCSFNLLLPSESLAEPKQPVWAGALALK